METSNRKNFANRIERTGRVKYSFKKISIDGEEEEEQRADYYSLSTRQDITLEQNKIEPDPNMWIMDSGSTSHMRFSKTGMTNLVPWKAPITLGIRQHIYSEMKGTFKGQILSEKGLLFTVTLDDVLNVPDIMMNLFSLTDFKE